ncbi:hypothetical protein Srot_0589 [Segniliparus rotundus DSM 44985]|uniref:Uncharacterized protein n=1 Tax=Segniliparus rotundus (strain ATCC BAA-972 / CDC 1076 / CIP 108378 / DSM 44985 / JCM 13578) TaxID=640132 RepID=D6ZCM9_SEGRD|nr:hypothetical protein [Segniliparus rotundus]ADG97071.1 hypothetical protein Srot_0589 [Segniliparus rotundus DSM 44985]
MIRTKAFAFGNAALLTGVCAGLLAVAQAQPAAADAELCGDTPHFSGCLSDDGSTRGCIHTRHGHIRLCNDDGGRWRDRDRWDD